MATDLGLDESIQELSQQVTAGIAAGDFAACLRKLVAFQDKAFGSVGNPFGSAARLDGELEAGGVPVLDDDVQLSDSVLPIGTAAKLDAGVQAGNVPVLDSDSELPESVLPIGTAAKLDAGAEAGNVPVLGLDGRLPGGVYDSIPISTTVPFAGSSLPEGWKRCNGDVLKRADYSQLYEAIGITYGAGMDDGLTFNLPDLRGRFPLGGGVTEDMPYTHWHKKLPVREVGDKGGSEKAFLGLNQIPAHDHQIPWYPFGVSGGSHHGHDGGLIADRNLSTDEAVVRRDSRRSTFHACGTGGTKLDRSDARHNSYDKQPPYLVLYYIIKAF